MVGSREPKTCKGTLGEIELDPFEWSKENTSPTKSTQKHLTPPEQKKKHRTNPKKASRAPPGFQRRGPLGGLLLRALCRRHLGVHLLHLASREIEARPKRDRSGRLLRRLRLGPIGSLFKTLSFCLFPFFLPGGGGGDVDVFNTSFSAAGMSRLVPSQFIGPR